MEKCLKTLKEKILENIWILYWNLYHLNLKAWNKHSQACKALIFVCHANSSLKNFCMEHLKINPGDSVARNTVKKRWSNDLILLVIFTDCYDHSPRVCVVWTWRVVGEKEIGPRVKDPKILVWKLIKMEHQKSKGQTAVINTGSRKKCVSVIT